MVSIYKLGKKWRVQASIGRGRRLTRVFESKQRAMAWGVEQERVGRGDKLPDKTFGDALLEYASRVAPKRNGGRWEVTRCKHLAKQDIAKTKLSDLSRAKFSEWRDARLESVKPATVLRDINLIRTVLKVCRMDWEWMLEGHNPIRGMTMPKSPSGRRRRISDDEIQRIRIAAGMSSGYSARTATERACLAFLFALETAMRSGEILSLTWDRVDLTKRYATLLDTKNGDPRDVPLTNEAASILNALPELDGPCFDLRGDQRDVLWRKIVSRSGVEDLHFHDSRAEGIWRLSKKLDVLQLARAIGHRDLKSLMIYYNESAEDMAKLLS